MTALPASGYLSNAERTQQQMKDALEDLRDFIEQRIGAKASTALVIASGSVTPTSARHTIDTESEAAADTLSNIALTNLADGSWLVFEAADQSRLVTVEHLASGDGEIELIAGHDILLQNRSRLILERAGTKWRQVIETLLPGSATGTSDDFWGATAPPRSVFMFGQTLDADENPDIAAACPNLVSGGNILVPDLRDRVTIGKGNMGGSATNRIDSSYITTTTLGATGGADDVTLADAQVPLRSHSHAAGGLSGGSHNHMAGSLGIQDPQIENNDPGAGVNTFSTADRAQGSDNVVSSLATKRLEIDDPDIIGSTANQSVSISGSTATAALSATAAVALLQPSIVCNKILWL